MADLSSVRLHLVESVDDAMEMKRWLSEQRPILCVDTETTGLKPWLDDVRLVQFGDAETGWAMAWDDWRGLAKEVLRSYEGPLVMHNAKYDVRMMRRGGVDVPWSRVHDTMIMSQLVDPTASAALKQLTTRLVDRRAGSMQQVLADAMTNAKWTWATVPLYFEPYWSYGALDAVLTARLYEVMQPQIETRGLTPLYEMEMAVLAVIERMETTGMKVDLDYADEQASMLRDFIAQAKVWGMNEHGISITSNQKLAARVRELGVELTERTKTGWKMDEDVLIALQASGVPAVEQLAFITHRVRKSGKIVTSYLENFHEIADHNSVVRAQIRTIGARTGRMSITDPALQTLPRASDGNPLAIMARNCFVAREGCKLAMVDFDQIELRLTGHFSQDPTIIDVLRGAGDPFTEFARRIYDDPTLEKKDPRRQLTKNASYAKLYGAGVAKFSATAGVSLEQGRAFMRVFDERFPGIITLQRRVETVAKQRLETEGEAYVVAPSGRRHVVSQGDGLYKLVNYLIQGTAADVLKEKLVALDLAGFGPYMRLPVHDEVVFEFPEEQAVDLAVEAVHVMREMETYSVPLPVGLDGPYDRWGQKYE